MVESMRAKMMVTNVERLLGGEEVIHFMAVCGSTAFGPEGESEDNTFARYTPQGELSLTVTNPVLAGKFKYGQKYYLDFTPSEQ